MTCVDPVANLYFIVTSYLKSDTLAAHHLKLLVDTA